MNLPLLDDVLDFVDTFAGPGGWDLAARHLRLDGVGIERDLSACLTRRAADLPTIGPVDADDPAGDVRDYGPATVPSRGLISSPPCQTFSAAGNRKGHGVLEDLLRTAWMMWGRWDVDLSHVDERSRLVLEPLRWILEAIDAGTPYEWVALEQVPSVLPIWQAIGEILTKEGYSVATGCLNAERFGVPQTRRRAVLAASRIRDVALPTPTHSGYYPRTPDKLDPGVLKWVSMADALGWGMTRRPYPTVACSRSTGGPDKEKVGGSHARSVIYRERNAGRWILAGGIPRPDGHTFYGTTRSTDYPAPTLAFGNDPASWRFYDLDGDDENGVRLSVESAVILQTFPADYPWQGGATKRFQQVGNAIPPLLAAHVLSAATGIPFDPFPS